MSVLAICFMVWQMVVARSEYMVEVARCTPFYTSSTYIHDALSQPAGLLTLCGGLVASLCIQPWIGTAVMSLLLLLIAFASVGAFRLRSWLSVCAFVAPLFFLGGFIQLGYMLYVLKAVAPGITPVVGTLCSVVLFWIYRIIIAKLRNGTISQWITAAVSGLWGILVVVCMYPFIGFFAPVAAALCMSYDLGCVLLHRPSSLFHRPSSLIPLLCTALAICLVPRIYFVHHFTTLPADYIYTVGLPDFRLEDDERQLFLPLCVAFAVLFVLAFVSSKMAELSDGKRRFASVLVLLAVAVSAVQVHFMGFRDANYHNILCMAHAIDRGDWQTVTDFSVANTGEEPTRAEVMMRNLALQKQGRAADSMFRLPDGDAEYVSPRKAQYLRLMCAHRLYYYYGKVNYSYRWAMEDMVEYGGRPFLLDYMARCAVVNGEVALAQKYIDQLNSRPLTHVTLADMQPCDSLSAMPLMSLRNFNNLLDGDAGLIEPYILNSFALTDGGSREMTDLSLQCALILKDIDTFWPRFMRLLPTFGTSIPRHYQEAVLLFAALQPQYDISQLPIDADIAARFERLVTESSQNAARGDEVNAQLLKPAFGDTYWYYYFFVKGLKTN